MSLLTALRIGASALTAQRFRMDVIANNIANVETTRTAEGGPFRAARVVFTPVEAYAVVGLAAATGRHSEGQGVPAGGVQVSAVVVEDAAPRLSYNPRHPDANADGYVAYPNVDLVTEMTDLLSASRAYGASVTALNAVKAIANKALEIARG